jgi:hypothetical protein
MSINIWFVDMAGALSMSAKCVGPIGSVGAFGTIVFELLVHIRYRVGTCLNGFGPNTRFDKKTDFE